MKRFNVQKIVNGVPQESNKKYLIINVDEPYAGKVFELIRDNEKAKGAWDATDNFKDFVEQI
jgi:hypothetical protein